MAIIKDFIEKNTDGYEQCCKFDISTSYLEIVKLTFLTSFGFFDWILPFRSNSYWVYGWEHRCIAKTENGHINAV